MTEFPVQFFEKPGKGNTRAVIELVAKRANKNDIDAVFCDEVPFGYVIDDVLYFKVDESNKPDYDKAGVTNWVASDKNGTRRACEVPADAQEDRETFKLWAERAIAVAKRRVTAKNKN